VEGVVVVGCSRELPTTLENEHKELVFEDGVVEVVPRSDHTRKRACSARFRGWWWWWWCQGVTTLENEHARLVFEDGGGE